MPAAIADYFRKSAMVAPTSLSAGLAAGAATANLSSTTSFPTSTPVTLTVDEYDTSTLALTGKKEVMYGIVSGLTVTNLVRGQEGTADQAHSTGAVVELLPNTADWNKLIDGMLIGHTQAGLHNAFTESNIVTTAALQAQAVTESKISASAIKLGYAQTTAAQFTLGAGPTDLTSLTVTITAPTARGIKITAYVPVICSVTTQNLALEIKEGATVLTASSVQSAIASVAIGAFAIVFIAAPSAGSHTYKLSTETSGGVWSTTPSATQPAFILAEAV